MIGTAELATGLYILKTSLMHTPHLRQLHLTKAQAVVHAFTNPSDLGTLWHSTPGSASFHLANDTTPPIAVPPLRRSTSTKISPPPPHLADYYRMHAKFGMKVAKESARNEKIAKKNLKAKSRAYAYAPKEPMRTHCHALGITS
ncbi:hypothetical protein PIB30_085584 [Stylosanthes scabra]|uniref:Uncharacterized protein n=1 Tax=Stylosanthes scabra TaxID=79078 RepID=A0ABU6QSF9_9FABA|nr:hypothetical protein [Stylosanthes scabra]